MIAIEVKSSRTDWLKELRNGEKGEAFGVLADRFYLAVGDSAIVKEGELPEAWGLMVPHGKGLRTVKKAPPLREFERDGLPPRFDRSFLAALLRAATKGRGAGPEAVEFARKTEREEARERYEQIERIWEERMRETNAILDRIKNSAGVRTIDDFDYQISPEEVGEALRLILDGTQKEKDIKMRLARQRAALSRMIEEIDNQTKDD